MAVGIICEYNPFHNGHLYHLNKVKEMFKDEEIILVLSGNYVQRGNISIIEKYDKTRIALNHGASLVVELPYAFATNSGDYFAEGAIGILNMLKCDKIVFGSESDDVSKLISLVHTALDNNKYDEIVKEYLKKGENYPTAKGRALFDLSGVMLKTPNDLLAFSYIKEIIKKGYKIKPISIKRTNNYNDTSLDNDISSATSIRKAINDKIDISKYVPLDTLKYIDYNNYDDKLFDLLKYKIVTDKRLDIYESVGEGIDKRIIKYINLSCNLDEFIKNIKSKRYTYNKVSRMLLHILMSFTKTDAIDEHNIRYIRVLGFNKKGKKYLNIIKKDISIPIITNINKDNICLLKTELKADTIYYLLKNKNINLYKSKPVIND